MSIFGVDFTNVATPLGITAIICIVLGMTIYFGFRYLKDQSELARINRELTDQVSKLSNDLGKTREAYERVVTNLDQSQQYVIFLQSWLDNRGRMDKHSEQKE